MPNRIYFVLLPSFHLDRVIDNLLAVTIYLSNPRFVYL